MRGVPLTQQEFDKVKTLIGVEIPRSEVAKYTMVSKQLVGAIANADSFDDYKKKQKEYNKNLEKKKIFEGAELIEDASIEDGVAAGIELANLQAENGDIMIPKEFFAKINDTEQPDDRDYDAEARYNMSKEGREENTLYHINNRLLAIDAKLDILMESSKKRWF